MNKMGVIILSPHYYSKDRDLQFAKHLVEQRARDIGAE